MLGGDRKGLDWPSHWWGIAHETVQPEWTKGSLGGTESLNSACLSGLWDHVLTMLTTHGETRWGLQGATSSKFCKNVHTRTKKKEKKNYAYLQARPIASRQKPKTMRAHGTSNLVLSTHNSFHTPAKKKKKRCANNSIPKRKNSLFETVCFFFWHWDYICTSVTRLVAQSVTKKFGLALALIPIYLAKCSHNPHRQIVVV
jgi:hypothetical protein